MNRIANKRKGYLDSAVQAGWIWLSELEMIRKLSMREHQSSLAALKDISILIIKALPHEFNCKDSLRRCHLHVRLIIDEAPHCGGGCKQMNKTNLKAFWHSFENFTGNWKFLYRNQLCPCGGSQRRVGHTDVQQRLCNVDLWCWTGSVEAAEFLTPPQP